MVDPIFLNKVAAAGGTGSSVQVVDSNQFHGRPAVGIRGFDCVQLRRRHPLGATKLATIANQINETACAYGTATCTWCDASCQATLPLTGNICGRCCARWCQRDLRRWQHRDGDGVPIRHRDMHAMRFRMRIGSSLLRAMSAATARGMRPTRPCDDGQHRDGD